MITDFSSEMSFQTTRSGGKGGQNVNKVETAVIAFFNISASQFLTPEQKDLLQQKLPNRINIEGFLWVKAQIHRTQLANKEEAIEKINKLIHDALVKKKARIATKVSRVAKEKRIESKKREGFKKAERRKWKPGDY